MGFFLTGIDDNHRRADGMSSEDPEFAFFHPVKNHGSINLVNSPPNHSFTLFYSNRNRTLTSCKSESQVVSRD